MLSLGKIATCSHYKYSKPIGSAALYALVSSSLTFSNKALPAMFGFNYPLFVLMAQMILLQAVLLALSATRTIKYPKINARGLLMHLPISFLYSINAALGRQVKNTNLLICQTVLQSSTTITIQYNTNHKTKQKQHAIR